MCRVFTLDLWRYTTKWSCRVFQSKCSCRGSTKPVVVLALALNEASCAQGSDRSEWGNPLSKHWLLIALFFHPSLFSLLPCSREEIWLRLEFPGLCLQAKFVTPPPQALGLSGEELIWQQGKSVQSSDTYGIRVYNILRACQDSQFYGLIKLTKGTEKKTRQNK